jgi:hypothetical protein
MIEYLSLIPEEYFLPYFLISLLLEVLISGFVFRMSLTFAGAHVTTSRALIFSVIIRVITLLIDLFVPPFFYGYYLVVLNALIWLLLVMEVFDISFYRTLLVVFIQTLINIAFIYLGIPFFIRSLRKNV